jgi:transposase
MRKHRIATSEAGIRASRKATVFPECLPTSPRNLRAILLALLLAGLMTTVLAQTGPLLCSLFRRKDQHNESASKRLSGTTRDGKKWLRRTLCQAAWAVTRKKGRYLAAQFKRLAARRGVKRAVMAVGHSMLIITYTMLKTGCTYHELGGSYLELINKDQLQRYFLKRLQRLGLTVTVQPVAATP